MQNNECVFIDGIRTPNARAHKDKGWFRDLRPDELLSILYKAVFERNPKIKPEEIDTIFMGTANGSGMQTDIGRFAWLASGLPTSVPSQTISNQCPSGLSATMDAGRAIMVGEADIVLSGGVEDMEKVPPGFNYNFPPRMLERFNIKNMEMGVTAEKVAQMYDISIDDMVNFAINSHKCASKAHKRSVFNNEIIPVVGRDEEGKPILVTKDQWIRETLDADKMKSMDTPFRENGLVSAATSSPLTAGAALILMMSREKADALGLSYQYKYAFGTQAGNDPTEMGIGPIPAIKKLMLKTGLSVDDIGAIELNEAFASQSLAIIRELGLDNANAPFEKVNTWGGAIALGHPLGQSGARLIVTLLNRLKTDYPEAKYGLATLCGGFGNSNAVLLERIR